MMNATDLNKGRQSIVYTVEFDTDASVITTIDQSQNHEDVEMIFADNGTVYMRQYEEVLGDYQVLYMSHQQWLDLVAGYRSPEGSFYLTEKRKGDKRNGNRG